jgi:hypothetical protein
MSQTVVLSLCTQRPERKQNPTCIQPDCGHFWIDRLDLIPSCLLIFADLSSSNPQRFQMLTGSLDFTDQAKAHGLAQYADVRRQEFAKEQEEKAKEEEEKRQKALAAR